MFDRGHFKKLSALYRSNRHNCCVYTAKRQAFETNIYVHNLPIADIYRGMPFFQAMLSFFLGEAANFLKLP